MAKVKAQFKSGDMVKLKRSTDDWGEVAPVYASYHCTAEDTRKWYADQRAAVIAAKAAGEDPFDICRDSAGESRLSPQGGSVKLSTDTAYRVLRARCRESFSYYNATGGWTKLLHLESGRDVYVNMEKLEKVVVEKSQ